MQQRLPSYFDFTNPGHVKLALLSQGIHVVSKDVFEKPVYAENQFPYGHSNREVKNYTKVPAEMLLTKDVYCGLQLRSSSPWKMKAKNDGVGLFYEGTYVMPLSFIPRPHFYGKQIADGIPSEKVGVLYGSKYVLSFFTRGYCHYFSIGKQCKFCSLNPTRKSLGKNNILFITPAMAKQVTELAFEEPSDIAYVNHCSGTHKSNDLGLKFQIDILKAIVSATPPGIKQHMLTMPPDNLNLLEDLRHAGLGTINFAIEVFDPKKFQYICEGKNTLYGRDNFFKAYEEAVRVFGKGNVYANFVGGLESIKTMEEGFWYLAERGVAPSINVFHPDPESVFAHVKPPTIEYLFNMVHAQDAVYKKHHFQPIYPKGGTRNSLDTEVYRGFFSHDELQH
ncbi:MAG: hypothetical protein NUV98_04295 [Candidatus Roizmanbacteria bacterium]|nr:hypothetical protein [Candidatus Roizmanbacteria bacterium]